MNLTLSLVSDVSPFSFTTHTQFQVQRYFLLDVAVRLCSVIVKSNCIPNSCMFHIAKTGPLRCCLCTCSFDIREDAKKNMTDNYNFCIGTEFCSICLKSFHLCCQILLRGFLPHGQSWPSNLVREGTIVLFVSDLLHGFPRLVHD